MITKRELLCAAGCGLLLLSSVDALAHQCEDAIGAGVTSQIEKGVFEGIATVQIGDRVFEDVPVSTVIVEILKKHDDGTIEVITSHTFTFEGGFLEGQFTTEDEALLTPVEPPCVFELTALLEEDRGEGDFDDFHAELDLTGMIDFCAGEASWDFAGEICLHGEFCFGRSPDWVCDGDVDGDGQVNPVDAGIVQAHFCYEDDCDVTDLCQFDVDCDGQINPVDSGIVQSLFGTCETPRDVCP